MLFVIYYLYRKNDGALCPLNQNALLVWRLIMNDIFNRNRGLVFEENDNHNTEGIASAAERAFEYAMDTSADLEAIEKLTSTEGYLLKLETIKQAEDMSSEEKLDAISAADDKFAANKERSAKLHMWMMAKKAGLILLFVGVTVALAASPVGQKSIKGVSGILVA